MRARSTMLLIAAALSHAPAVAGSLRVDPVQVVINDDRRTAAVKIVNEDSASSTLKISAFAWSQVNGKDVYQPTDDLIASPPIASIEPGSAQTVRIGFRHPSNANRGSYRIIIEEVPKPSVAGIQVALRLNLPLYARIQPGESSALAWVATRQGDGAWVVKARNPTDGFVRVTPMDFSAASGLTYSDNIRLGSVLPHSSLEWTVGNAPQVTNSARWHQIARGENERERPALAFKGD
jgi:fimbrial chaperone protein